GWIATEYNNQSSPVTFVSVGPEQALNSLVSAGVCNGPLALTGYPAGGAFSGPGVSGNSFNPSTAGVGTHTITYTHNVDGRNVSISMSRKATPLPQSPWTYDTEGIASNVDEIAVSASKSNGNLFARLINPSGSGTSVATCGPADRTSQSYMTKQ